MEGFERTQSMSFALEMTSKIFVDLTYADSYTQGSIPRILAEAFPYRQNSMSTPTNLWGVIIDPRNPEDARVSALLMRFLRTQYGGFI
jgi:hypothetical protein